MSTRLKDSAAVLVVGEHDPMRALAARAGCGRPEGPSSGKPVLELNVSHPLVKYLENRDTAADFAELAQVLYDQAMFAEGRWRLPTIRVRSFNGSIACGCGCGEDCLQ